MCSKDDDLNWRLEEYGRHVSNGSTKPLKRDLWKGQRKSKTPKPAQEKKGKENCMGEHLWPHSAVQSSCIFLIYFLNLHLLHADTVNREIFTQELSSWQKKISQKSIILLFHRDVWHGPKNRPGLIPCKKQKNAKNNKKCGTCYHSKETTVLVSPWDRRHWFIKQHITCTSLNTIYIIMCDLHNKWYVESSTDLKAHWRNHKSNAKLMKATKCGVSSHGTKCMHPEDPNLAILLSWPSNSKQ